MFIRLKYIPTQKHLLTLQQFTYGKIAVTVALSGNPLPLAAKLFVNWWTAAFAIPYPIIPVNKEWVVVVTCCCYIYTGCPTKNVSCLKDNYY